MVEAMTQSTRPILQLPPHVVNKIAAGEVVVHPKNAVKELLENAIDAGATEITVTVKNGGLDLIKVVDNGSGIAPEDYARVCERHSTSKLSTLEDLKAMGTLGFRGEALLRLSRVSPTCRSSRARTAFRTRGPASTKVEKQHWMLVEASFLFADCKPTVARSVSAGLPGTQVIAEQLYKGLDRREVFSGNTAELSTEIASLLVKYAINFPYIAIAFVRDDKGTKKGSFRSSGGGNQQETIRSLLSSNVTNQLFELEVADENLRFSAHFVMANPLSSCTSTAIQAKNDKSKIFQLFINNRLVTSDKLKKAVNSTFSSVDCYCPFMAISMQIDPAYIDVNAHPTKETVIFLNENAIIQRIDAKLLDAVEPFRERRTIELSQTVRSSMVKTVPQASHRPLNNQSTRGEGAKAADRKRKLSGDKTNATVASIRGFMLAANADTSAGGSPQAGGSRTTTPGSSKKVAPKLCELDGRNHRIEEYCTPMDVSVQEPERPYTPSLPPGEITIDEEVLDTPDASVITLDEDNEERDESTQLYSERSQFYTQTRTQSRDVFREHADPTLTALLKHFVLVGFVDNTRIAFQSEMSVYLMDILPWIEEMFFQVSAHFLLVALEGLPACSEPSARSGSWAARRILIAGSDGAEKGVSLMGMAIRYMERTGCSLPDQEDFGSQSECYSTHLQRLQDEDVLQKLWMDFGICLESRNGGCDLSITAIIALHEEYTPMLVAAAGPPRLRPALDRLGSSESSLRSSSIPSVQPDGTVAKCVARAMARLQTPHALRECAEETRVQQHAMIASRLLPWLKLDFAPSSELNQHITPLISTSQAFKIFGRC
ncbi:ATP-binding region and DNA mismatch repair protein domain containing protein [Aphelenchoides fujianensis]|nr:ATP-binding region and DNA mismatch repair protein domain containing protein [Aphelenchoides fujianensis]